MPAVTPELIALWPKAELHVHLDGSLRPETMLDLADDAGVTMPESTPQALADHLLVRDAHNLEEYLAKYSITLSVMQTPEALERVAYEFVRDVAKEHVRYVEARYCPALHMPALSIDEALEAPLAGLARAAEETGTMARVIVCGLRTLDPATSLEMARAAVRFQDQGVVAFDLAGSEIGHPAAEHEEAFHIAGEAGLATTCHAGEGDGAHSIRQALEICRAQRIGHGTRLHEDTALERMVRDQGIPLEVCLTSNMHTHTVPDIRNHPIRRYFDAGIPVTLNTDSRLMDGITLNEEYWKAHTMLGFSRSELLALVRNAFQHAFLPESDKAALIRRIEDELEEIG